MNIVQSGRMKAVASTILKDRFSWFLLPWIISGSSFVVNLITAYFANGEITTGGVASLYIYMFAAGIMSVSNTLPFLLGFSVRRSDYFWGTGGVIGLVGVICAAGLSLLSYVESEWLDGWGVGLYFFHLPYVSEGSVAVQFLVYFLLIVFLFYLGFLIACVAKRFGKNGMFILAIAVLAIGTVWSYVMTQQGWWIDLGQWLADRTMLEIAGGTAPLTLLYMALSYALLRRTSV
ncbi:hypothetical protein [Cohnella rhizosphaerae]|uniref:Uncharacterized protein n=1 Tax=Cohnella rhizosphaerae TaxID=1457232 RepID=A0A9X4QVJ8_9BACL|nr:hypothetical protein [Cohnella rhizosphaerae]MDG0811572.1 hypothetical protein [Cohnella rhizosphaerae]